MAVIIMLFFILSLAFTISTFLFMVLAYFNNSNSSKLSELGSIISSIQHINNELHNNNQSIRLCVRIFWVSLLITVFTKWLL